MTGQMVFRAANVAFGWSSQRFIDWQITRPTRVTFAFEDGSHLYFNDQRKFGWVRLHANPGSAKYRLYEKSWARAARG